MLTRQPLKQFFKLTSDLWDRDETSPNIRKNLNKVLDCRTPVLGAEIYASEFEVKEFCHTCKGRFCTGCGNRATLLFQRELWRALPNIPYAEICFTMPKEFWPFIHRDRRLLVDLVTLAASVIKRWVKAKYNVVPLILMGII